MNMRSFMRTWSARVVLALHALPLLCLATASWPVHAGPLFFVGQVVEDTPARTPVAGALVGVYFFETNPGSGPELHRFPSGFIPTITNHEGLFAVYNDPEDTELRDKARVVVTGTLNPRTGHLTGAASETFIVETRPSIQHLFFALGFAPTLEDVFLAAVSKVLGYDLLPELMSTTFVSIGGAGIIPVDVVPAPASLVSLASALAVGMLARRRAHPRRYASQGL